MQLTLPPETPNPRTILFGIDCHFTNLFLQSALSESLTIAAVVLPGPPRASTPFPAREAPAGLPVARRSEGQTGVLATAADQRIPAYRFGRLTSAEALTKLKSFNAGFLICACYPRKIPTRVTQQFPGRALNAHPSLLPALRGPDPLFWTFREGSGEAGITIHELSPEYDAGPILAQERHSYPDGTRESELEAVLARRAGALVARIVERRCAGEPVRPREQDHTMATYAPFPRHGDYHLEQTMSARVAFNFARGIEARGVPLTIDDGNQRLTISRVYGYERDGKAIQPEQGRTAIPLSDGFLIVDLM